MLCHATSLDTKKKLVALANISNMLSYVTIDSSLCHTDETFFYVFFHSYISFLHIKSLTNVKSNFSGGFSHKYNNIIVKVKCHI